MNGVIPQRYEFTAPTNEDWYPTTNGELRCFVGEIHGGGVSGDLTTVRIALWGGDDFGMQKDFPIEIMPFELAVIIADGLPKPIRRDELLLLGFAYA
jgi:hypothetical protein